MYQAYWGLSHSPFAPAAIRQLLDSQPQCGEALARLDFLVEHKSRFGLLTGPAGSGKSLILGEFVRRQREVGAAAAAVRATGLSASDLLAEVAAVWGCDPAVSATSAVIWRRVADRLAEFRLEQVPAVLALDDLDQAASDARHAIQRLLQLPDVDLTVVAAASDDGLSGLGRLVDHADLRVELACWSVDDTRNYLSASLASAGRQQTVFAERAVQRLFQLSGGLPRRVGQLAQLALIAGAGQSLTQIDEQTVLAVHDELSAAR
jgi:general secretion pathway protein A